MLTIKAPNLFIKDNKVRLESVIFEDAIEKKVWIDFDLDYAEYVCSERSDAFVVALLKYAMQWKHNIVCETPIGSELYYNLTEYLIPNMILGNSELYNITINAPIDYKKIKSKGAVGTGISCGIDSLHAVATHGNDQLCDHKVTHLTFNNVGSHGEGERALKLYLQRKQRAVDFCSEYGYNLVLSDSNIHDVFKQSHYHTHTFTSMFPVLALQKLYGIYLYASSAKLSDFTFKSLTPGKFEYVILSSISSSNIRIYSQGANCSRHDKTEVVSRYEPSYKYLNVCTEENKNCSKCEKCLRTLFSLEKLGVLEKYKDIFDLDVYKKYRNYGLRIMIYNAVLKNDSCYIELQEFYKKDILLKFKIEMYLRKKFERYTPSFIISILKRIKK